MRREGTDPNNVHMDDVLCDFCRCSWTAQVPFIEGHHGSCICGSCLASAFRHVVGDGADDRPPDNARVSCVMCLEPRDEPCYRSPEHGAFICTRCIELASKALERDPDFAWRRPPA